MKKYVAWKILVQLSFSCKLLTNYRPSVHCNNAKISGLPGLRIVQDCRFAKT